ncbi:MAG: hypothetical protein ABI779_07060 [Acidobacteriota bacterium]
MSCNIPSPETPLEYLPPRYFKRISGAAGGAFRELVTPPTLAPSLRLSLTRDIEGKRAMAHLHSPGDGWHYLPTRAEYVHNGSYWFSTLGTSEGPILANVADLCDEIGAAFDALYRTAYPEDRSVPEVSAEDRAMRSRPATIRDASKVLHDLEDVNYHALYGALHDALRARGIPTE